jgi:hypothetical protein
MSSIAVIVRADEPIASLARDWVPEPLGEREAVVAAIQELSPPGVVVDGRISLAHLALELAIEAGPAPRSITVSGTWGEAELGYLNRLCRRLRARCFDSELCEYIDS